VAPLPPEEALRQAAEQIDALLAEDAAFAPKPFVPEQRQEPDDPSKVTVWYCAHPILGKALGPRERVAAYNASHSGTLDPHFIGEWRYAIQKLTVSLAANDLPDVALVKRAWLARLIGSGRIAALDTLLPAPLVEDIRPEVREALSANGHLYAFPCDGFCSVLFYNKTLVNGDPPDTWGDLRETAAVLAAQDKPPGGEFWTVGHVPYIESLLSAGGELCAGARSGLETPEALEALRYLLSLRDEGLAHPGAQGHPARAFELFLAGRVAMTVASSELAARASRAPFPVGMAAVPGKTGPVSLFSDNALVVFLAHAEARRAAIGEFLDFITGPGVLGQEALGHGSVPVRTRVASGMTVPDGPATAFANLRWTPLVGPWGSVEFEINRSLSLAYRWEPQSGGQGRVD
jgi:ABC-type glycerol-3-phosphate transport system substrate-binding protein